MYRLFAIVALLNTFTNVATASDCNNRKSLDFLNSLSADIIKVDNKLKEVCKQFPSIMPTEKVDEKGYKLEYSLPEFSGNFIVKIKHRMLSIIGHDLQQKVCDRTYVDMRVLPDYLNGHEATWYFQYGTLTVDIPFRFKSSEASTHCGFRIDETLIHVRKGYSSSGFGDYS